MKRKTTITILISLVIVLVAITVAGAQNIRNVDQDTFWWGTADPGDVNGAGQNVIAEGGTAACDVTRAGLLKWNLSDIDDAATVGNATIVLNQVNFSTQTDGTTLALFEAPDTWDETTTQGTLPIPPASTTTPLATVSAPFPVGSNITFQVTGTGDPLIQYIQAQITSDDTVSFWVEFTGGCPAGGTALIAFNSKEAGTSTLELSTPTNVTLSNFSADNTQPVNYALYIGLAALAVLGIGAAGYGYSRTR